MELRDARLRLIKSYKKTGKKSKVIETAIRSIEALESLEDFFIDNAVSMEKGIRHEDAETYKNIVRMYVKNVEDDEREG